MSSDAPYAFLMPVGPGEAEIAVNNIKMIGNFYPSAWIVAVDDCTSDGTYEELRRHTSIDRLILLRNAEPAGYLMLINTFVFGVREIMKRIGNIAFVIRLDADCAVLGPGLDEAFRLSFSKCKTGIVGQYKFTDEGTRRDWGHMKRKAYMDLMPIGLAKTARRDARWNKIRIGWPPYIRHLLKAKVVSGYEMAENIFGPCYAIHGSTLEKMERSGFLNAVSQKFECAMHEDELLVSLGAKSVGDDLHDISELGFPKITHLRYTTPPRLSPSDLIKSGAAVAHSLKQNRAEMREYRRELMQLVSRAV
jgi:hypothetical protein